MFLLGNAEAEAEEMDIDETTPGIVPDESAYIGDNCLSTPVSLRYFLKLGFLLVWNLYYYFEGFWTPDDFCDIVLQRSDCLHEMEVASLNR